MPYLSLINEGSGYRITEDYTLLKIVVYCSC